jgi:hypothetical protein
VAHRFTLPARILCTVIVAGVGLALGVSGCTGQGEGDRCTFFPNSALPSVNGTDECQDGLVCTPAFNITEFPYDRCCPPVLTQSTVPACSPNGIIDGGNPTSGRDATFDTTTDTNDATTQDAKKDAPKESAADAKKDASSDAPSDTPSDVMEDGG